MSSSICTSRRWQVRRRAARLGTGAGAALAGLRCADRRRVRPWAVLGREPLLHAAAVGAHGWLSAPPTLPPYTVGDHERFRLDQVITDLSTATWSPWWRWSTPTAARTPNLTGSATPLRRPTSASEWLISSGQTPWERAQPRARHDLNRLEGRIGYQPVRRDACSDDRHP